VNSDISSKEWAQHYSDFKAWLASDLGIPDRFLQTLKEDDDWTYIIKLHALIEAALNHLLAFHFRALPLAKVFSNLDTSNKRCGKVAFVRALGLLPEDACKFISLLSEIRNFLVHDARKFVFSIDDYFCSLDKHQRKNFVMAASSGFLPATEIAGKIMEPEEIAGTYPRYAIFAASFVVVTRTHHYRKQVEHDHRIDQAMIRLGELAFQSFGHNIPQRAISNLSGNHSANI